MITPPFFRQDFYTRSHFMPFTSFFLGRIHPPRFIKSTRKGEGEGAGCGEEVFVSQVSEVR